MGRRLPEVGSSQELSLQPLLDGQEVLLALLAAVALLVVLNMALTAATFWVQRQELERIRAALRQVDLVKDTVRQINLSRRDETNPEDEVELIASGTPPPRA